MQLKDQKKWLASDLINEMFSVVSSNDKEYSKADKLFNLCDSSKVLFNLYNTSLKSEFEKMDNSSILDYKTKYINILTLYKEYESKGIIADVRYFYLIQHYLETFKYCKFIISSYISLDEFCNFDKFLLDYGIDKDIFNYCVDNVKELDVDLYNLYISKKVENDKLFVDYTKEVMHDIYNGITTGQLLDETNFDLLEFMKRIPFYKNSTAYFHFISRFLKENNVYGSDVIIDYMKCKHMNISKFYFLLTDNVLRRTKTIVNGREVSSDDVDIIVKYLKCNNVPIVNSTYLVARDKYLNGEIDIDTLNELDYMESNKARVLIP